MLKVFVHLHLYYHDQVDFFISRLENINGVEWDLTVTYSEWNEESAEKIKKLKPDASFIKVPNYGYDIWPFIKVIRETDLDNYDLVIKLHTKRAVRKSRSNVVVLRGYQWRDALVDGLLFSKEYFSKIVQRFIEEPDLGMVSSLLTYTSREWYFHKVRPELDRLGLSKSETYLCRGSMFMMRTEPLKFLRNPLIGEELFKNDIPVSGTSFQNAHLYERILCHLPINAGLRHEPVYPHKSTIRKIKVIKFLEPIGKFIFYCEKEGVPKKLVIRILGLKIYQGK